MLCYLAICAQLILGLSRESEPPNGTWWQADTRHSFSKFGGAYGLALVGHHWSVQVERLGRSTSYAIACGGIEPQCKNAQVPYSTWRGQEQPIGAWAIWEPAWRSFFGQLGGGVTWPHFMMDVPDYSNASLAPKTIHITAVNNVAIASPLAGLGYRTKYADLVFNWRLIRTVNSGQGGPGAGPATGNFQGLGWSEYEIFVRSHF